MRRTIGLLPLLLLLAFALAFPALAEEDPDMTTITVEVMTLKDKPIARASVVVRFVEGRSIVKLGKKIMTSYQLRTSNQGKVVVPPIPQGKILIQVIAKGYQTYGEYHEIYEGARTVAVRLKPPQSQYSAHDEEPEPKKAP